MIGEGILQGIKCHRVPGCSCRSQAGRLGRFGEPHCSQSWLQLCQGLSCHADIQAQRNLRSQAAARSPQKDLNVQSMAAVGGRPRLALFFQSSGFSRRK